MFGPIKVTTISSRRALRASFKVDDKVYIGTDKLIPLRASRSRRGGGGRGEEVEEEVDVEDSAEEAAVASHLVGVEGDVILTRRKRRWWRSVWRIWLQ